MNNIKTYNEMNEIIKKILVLSDKPNQLYAHQYILKLEKALYDACEHLSKYLYYGECPSAYFGRENYFEDCKVCDYENQDVTFCWCKYFL